MEDYDAGIVGAGIGGLALGCSLVSDGERYACTAELTATESRFYHWLGKRIILRTGRNRDLMRTALQGSSGLTDHFTIRETIRFLN